MAGIRVTPPHTPLPAGPSGLQSPVRPGTHLFIMLRLPEPQPQTLLKLLVGPVEKDLGAVRSHGNAPHLSGSYKVKDPSPLPEKHRETPDRSPTPSIAREPSVTRPWSRTRAGQAGLMPRWALSLVLSGPALCPRRNEGSSPENQEHSRGERAWSGVGATTAPPVSQKESQALHRSQALQHSLRGRQARDAG